MFIIIILHFAIASARIIVAFEVIPVLSPSIMGVCGLPDVIPLFGNTKY